LEEDLNKPRFFRQSKQTLSYLKEKMWQGRIVFAFLLTKWLYEQDATPILSKYDLVSCRFHAVQVASRAEVQRFLTSALAMTPVSLNLPIQLVDLGMRCSL